MKKTHITGRNTIIKTRKRIIIIFAAFMLFSAILVSNLIKLQVISHSYYKDKVNDQITTTSKKRAERGNIYDSNMNVLATTNTVWRVFISTRDIKKAEKEENIAYGEKIAYGLSNILDISPSPPFPPVFPPPNIDISGFNISIIFPPWVSNGSNDFISNIGILG